MNIQVSKSRYSAGKLWLAACLLLLSSYGFAQSNITHAEYYLDNDPGIGNGTPITITTPGTNLQNLSVTFNVSALKNGSHFFGTRARTADGVWGMNHYWILFKPYDVVLTPGAITNITRVEYFVDNDPGIGNGIAATISTPGTNLTDLTFSIDPNPLAPGLHTVGSRAMTADGKWSKTNYWMFQKPRTNLQGSTAPSVTNVEYYIDNDPGIGKATPISISPSISVNDINASIGINDKAAGTHLIGIRAKDANGSWSLTNHLLFVKPLPTINATTAPNITSLEYFIDYDPGFGKGTPISISPGTSIPDATFNVDVSDLIGGTHFITVRARDANGSWSLVNSWEFTKPGTPPTLTTVVTTSALCAGSNLNVGYLLSDPVAFKPNNKYVVQLSQYNGTFENPVEIGSINATNTSGTISCVIPANAVEGSSYRVRVISTNQTILGSNNGSNIMIYALPKVPAVTRPAADSTVCAGNELKLIANSNTYNPQWLLNGQPIPGATSHSYTVPSATTAHAGAYSLRLTNATTCHVYSPVINIAINSIVPDVPTVSPSGNIGICLGNSMQLTSTAASNNQWYKDGNPINGATGQQYAASTAGTYTVRVSNTTGCTTSSTTSAVVTLGVAVPKPTVTPNGPTTFCQNLNVSLASSSFSNNQWYRNGVAISGATAQSYSATQSGYYKVIVAGGGCEAISDSILVTVNPNLNPSVSMTAGNNVPVGTPITFTATAVNGGSAPIYTFKVNNNTVQTGASNTWTSSTLVQGDVVSCTMTSNAVCATSVNVNSNSITVNVIAPVSFSGRISHPTGLLIPTPKVRLSGGMTDSTIADDFGNYNFTLFQQRNYTVAPTKNNDFIKSKGVNVLDVLQMQSHILGTTLLNSPYKIIAADVNTDNSVNIFDILAVKRLILGMDTSFAGNKLWAFVDSTQTFANPSNPFPYQSSKSYTFLTTTQTKQSFYGMKLGDVNFDWTPTAGQNRTNQGGDLQIYYDTVYADQGETARLKVRVRNFNELLGMQFTIGFNKGVFDFAGIENKQIAIEHGLAHIKNGAVTFIWADASNMPKTMADGSVLFELLLHKNRSAVKEDIRIENGYTPAFVFGADYEPSSVEKKEGAILEKKAVAPPAISTLETMDVKPNPSNGLINVAINSTVVKKITLSVSDELGRVIFQQPVELSVGLNNLQLNLREKGAVSAGIYYLNATGLDVKVKKLVIINQ